MCITTAVAWNSLFLGSKSIELVFAPEVVDITLITENESLPDGCVKYGPEVFGCLSSLFVTTEQESFSAKEVDLRWRWLSWFWCDLLVFKNKICRKRRLIHWLEENTIEVVEQEDGTLTVFGSVRICEPFTSQNCYCSVPLVLARVRKLIDAMPAD